MESRRSNAQYFSRPREVSWWFLTSKSSLKSNTGKEKQKIYPKQNQVLLWNHSHRSFLQLVRMEENEGKSTLAGHISNDPSLAPCSGEIPSKPGFCLILCTAHSLLRVMQTQSNEANQHRLLWHWCSERPLQQGKQTSVLPYYCHLDKTKILRKHLKGRRNTVFPPRQNLLTFYAFVKQVWKELAGGKKKGTYVC